MTNILERGSGCGKWTGLDSKIVHVIETAERSEDDAKSRSGAKGRGRRPSPVTQPRDFAEDDDAKLTCRVSSIMCINELGTRVTL